MIELPERSFMDSRGNTAPICLLSSAIWSLYGWIGSTSGMSSSLGTGSPWLLPNHGLRVRSPSGGKSRSMPLSFITAVSAAGMWEMLVTTAPAEETMGFSGV